MVLRVSMAWALCWGSGAMPAGAFATMLTLYVVPSVSDFGTPTGSSKLARFHARLIRLSRGIQVAVTRPPASNRGAIVMLSLQGHLTDATRSEERRVGK